MEENPRSSPEANDISDYPDLEGNRCEEAMICEEATSSCGEQPPLPEPSTPKPPEVQLESRLAVGQVMKSVEDAYLLYCKYAHAKGFSVKKGDQHCFPRSNELRSKDFECSCEGVSHEKRSSSRKQPGSIRTQCKARLKVGREKGGEWKITRFVMEHNHEMFQANRLHLLRSTRISHARKSALEAMVNAGISIANAVSYMEEEAHGAQDSNFAREDAYDSLSRLRKHTKIENGDASELIKHFINKSNNESFFYWDVQLDDDYRVLNFFFRDYRCRIDYESFGDVLLVDTTYRNNKYDLVCAPFVGINHHRQNVMFGLAFMSDESEDSFEWLFRTFRESMDGKQPETIFSNQCQAMMNAIERVFPSAHYRLCQWHINQNIPLYLGSISCDSRFEELWNKCMNYCDSEEEFETIWKNMIDEFNLGGQNWLNGMYKLRHRWASAFSNHRFCAGFLATSRSESTSSFFRGVGDRSMSLYNFVLNCEKMQKKLRANEKAEDCRCWQMKPPMIVKNNPLLNHAANVYTINVYNLFELELVESLSTEFTEQPSFAGPFLTPFKVTSHDQDSKVREVVFDEQKNEIKCSCYKFESMGILCKHALKVLNFVKVHTIPENYIKKRWTKKARNRVLDEGSGTCHTSRMAFVNQYMRLFYDLAMRCKTFEVTRNKLTEILNDATEKVDDLFEHLSLNDLNACGDLISDEHNDQANEKLLHKSNNGKGKEKAESSKRIEKGTKRKGTMCETATNECPSGETTTHATVSQEANIFQPSAYQMGYPFQMASITPQSYAGRPHWSYPMPFATISPMTRDMHLGGQSKNNWGQPK